MDKGQTMMALKELMSQVEPLPDEPHFATSDETIVRFLKCSDWKLREAEKALLNTIEFRRQNRPLRRDCQWCKDRPGYHSMRQIGHDESGRPVIYANFAQASTHKNTVEDVVTHVTYLIENAKATMEVGVTTWVFVIDCTGMTMSACNPKLGYGMASILSNHYPERLGLVICVNHNPMFHGVWKALKKVVSPGTSSKVRLVRSPSKVHQVFSTFFPEELTAWIMEEIELNKQKPLPKSQQEFWAAPTLSPTSGLPAHDPRGCPSYINDHILPFYHRQQNTLGPGLSPMAGSGFFKGLGNRIGIGSSSSSSSSGSSSSSSRAGGGGGADDNYGGGAVVPRHRPHPNVAASLFGSVPAVSQTSQEQAARVEASEDVTPPGQGRVSDGADLSAVPENGHLFETHGQSSGVKDDKDDDNDNLFADDTSDDNDEGDVATGPLINLA